MLCYTSMQSIDLIKMRMNKKKIHLNKFDMQFSFGDIDATQMFSLGFWWQITRVSTYSVGIMCFTVWFIYNEGAYTNWLRDEIKRI